MARAVGSFALILGHDRRKPWAIATTLEPADGLVAQMVALPQMEPTTAPGNTFQSPWRAPLGHLRSFWATIDESRGQLPRLLNRLTDLSHRWSLSALKSRERSPPQIFWDPALLCGSHFGEHILPKRVRAKFFWGPALLCGSHFGEHTFQND